MSKLTNVLLSFIIVLLLVNVALTMSILQNKNIKNQYVGDAGQHLDVTTAKHWGNQVADMYNKHNHKKLYSLFSDQAKVKITVQQLQSQLDNLFNLFGEIQEIAFISATKIGEMGNDNYFKLLFNIRVHEDNKKLATLTISVVRKDNLINLYGLKINARHSLD